MAKLTYTALRLSIIGITLATGCHSLRGNPITDVSISGADTTSIARLHTLDEVQVIAHSIKDDVTSTAPLFRIDDERMKALGVTDLTDALHRMPGLNIRDYGGAGGVKTVSVRGFGSAHTGVIYDGVALSDAQTGTIDLSRYSLDNVDEVALIIGDNSDIFMPAKAAATAASIIINTGSVPSESDNRWYFNGQIRFGSFGLINPYFKLAGTLNPKFSFSTIGEYTYAKNDYPYTLHNGQLTTRERRENSRMHSGHGEINLRWRPGDTSALDAKIYYYDNNRQLPGPVVLYNPTSDDSLHDRNFFGQLTYYNKFSPKVQIRAISKFNWDATYYHEVDGKHAGGFKDENYVQREVYLSGAALYTPTHRFSFNYALDYSYNNLSSNLATTVGPWRHSVIQALSGKFSNHLIQVMARILCSSYINGVKSGESIPDRTKLTPSLSMSIRPWHSRLIYLRASYKNIFRFPTFNESYYYHLGSLQLRPEETHQFNIGATWQTGLYRSLSTLALTGDIYYNIVKDKIVAIPMNMFVWTMANLDKVRAFGADITLDCSLSLAQRHNLLINGNYSWQRVQPRTAKSDPEYNKQVAYTPQHSGALSVTWQNPWTDLVIKATGVSARYGTNANLPSTRLPGYIELGAALMRTFNIKNHSIDLRLDILNLLDTQYEIVRRYPMPGRSFRFTAGFKL